MSYPDFSDEFYYQSSLAKGLCVCQCVCLHMFDEMNWDEDINVKLHSNTFSKTKAKPFNLITKSQPSLTIKSSLCI